MSQLHNIFFYLGTFNFEHARQSYEILSQRRK